MKIATSFVLAVIAAMLVGWLGRDWASRHEPSTVPVAASTSACGKLSSPVMFHVRHNNYTSNSSKFVETKDGIPQNILQGPTLRDDHIFKCAVSKEFFDAVSENQFVTIPCEKCEEIKP